MSLRRKIMHRVGGCFEDLSRLQSRCVNAEQRAEIDAVIACVSKAFELAEQSKALGAAERRPKASAFNFEALCEPSDCLRVTPSRVTSARVAASSWGKRHGIRLSVTKLEDGSAEVRRVFEHSKPDDAF